MNFRITTNISILAFLAGFMLLLSSCRPTPQAQNSMSEVEAISAAESATNDLMQNLVSELTSAMEAGGPANAVEVCAGIAQKKTESVGEENNLSIRRVALRTRNPLNTPTQEERAVLEQWMAQEARPESWSEIDENEEGQTILHYMRPIFLADKCVVCHGPEDQIDPAVKEIIKANYPEDQATGFQPGDLRGAFSVQIVMNQP
jgi:hypothetical protein